jgi:hypothetical protein
MKNSKFVSVNDFQQGAEEIMIGHHKAYTLLLLLLLLFLSFFPSYLEPQSPGAVGA